VCLVGALAVHLGAEEPPARKGSSESSGAAAADAERTGPEFETLVLRGRVVFLAEAMQRRFGIEIDADAREANIALETEAGELLPLAKDARGRGFFLDPRLREFDDELVVRRFKGAPVAQIVRVRRLRDGQPYELDYWCDICAIPTYELKPCECCQGPTRFRERPLDPDGEPLEEERPAR
jgi:hypothetical protein